MSCQHRILDCPIILIKILEGERIETYERYTQL